MEIGDKVREISTGDIGTYRGPADFDPAYAHVYWPQYLATLAVKYTEIEPVQEDDGDGS